MSHSSQAAPWLRRKDWSAGRVKSTRRALFWISWVIALATNALAMPLLMVIPDELAQGNMAMALAAVFPLIGIATLAWAGLSTVRRLRYGRSSLDLETLPGVIGGTFRGTVRISRFVDAAQGFQVVLSCVRRITTRDSDGDESVDERPQWQDERWLQRHELSGAAQTGGTAIPIDFTIPYASPASSPTASDDEIVWRLHVRADVPGADYAADFVIPVFETSESSPEITQATVDELARARRSGPARAPSDPRTKSASGIRRQPRADGGIELLASAPRMPLPGALLLVVALLLAGVAWGLVELGVAAGGVLVGVLALAAIYGVSILWFRSTRVIVSSRGIELRNRTLGLGRTRVIEGSAIERIEADSPHTGPTSPYTVQAVRASKLPLGLISGVRSQSEARDLAAAITTALGR